MPIWHVLHPDIIFTDPREKAELVKTIVGLYTSGGLPPFYVNVFFHKFAPGDAWSDTRYQGGIDALENNAVAGVSQRKRPFVHFEIDQIAVNITSDEWAARWCERLNEALKPHIADKGYDWEYHIDETPRSLWRTNGLSPPPWKSVAERKWFDANQPLPWDKSDAKLVEKL
ncbi:hypothetical protein E8E14_011731 [Neopestalotiopsis sp. 37M]|nr:hypothetical protein E8E14_011731 [Neopestalotiopsis sp. 37M]